MSRRTLCGYLRRTLGVCLALAANLIAASAPFMHAAAHALHDGDAAPHATVSGTTAHHGESEVHASALHDREAGVQTVAPTS